MQSAGPSDRPLLVLVSGAPGSGKTTLAIRLSEELGLMLLAKDRIKEALGDVVGIPEDVAGSQRLGGAAYAALFALAEATLAAGRSLVVESNFWRGASESELVPMSAGRDTRLIHCTCAPSLAEARYQSRIESGSRHPVHWDEERRMALVEAMAGGRFDPVDLGCPTLVVDTTSGYRPDLDRILAFVRADGAVPHA